MIGTEYCVVGLQRSGNHAVINWILSQSLGDAHFLSDIRAGENPYRTINEFEHYHNGKIVFRQNLWTPKERRAFAVSKYGKALQGELERKETVLYNFEDQPISSVFSESFTSNLTRWIGASSKRYNIMILRDPFNFLASRIKAGERLAGVKEVKEVIELWKDHARWFLRFCNADDGSNICVNFPRWHITNSYRSEVAQKLGLRFSDAGRQVVPPFLGSSFDGMKFNGRAQNMQVNRRWIAFKDDPDFWSLCADEEVLILAEDIFGDIPTVQEALKQVVSVRQISLRGPAG